MRWLLLFLVFACRQSKPAPPPTCYSLCHDECSRPVRSELINCHERCFDRCGCFSLETCGPLDDGQWEGPFVVLSDAKLVAFPDAGVPDAALDARVPDAPDR